MQPKPHFCSFFLNDCDEIIHCIHLITAVSHLISSDLAPSVVCIFHSWTSLLHELYSSSLTAFALCCAWENKMLSVFQEWKQTLKKKKLGNSEESLAAFVLLLWICLKTEKYVGAVTSSPHTTTAIIPLSHTHIQKQSEQ